jgi:hypothetical protein
MPMWTNCKSLDHVPHTDWAVLPNGAAISKFPPLDTISLYHSSLGALEQPGEVNIMPEIGRWTSGYIRIRPENALTSTICRPMATSTTSSPTHFAGVVIEPDVATVNDVK